MQTERVRVTIAPMTQPSIGSVDLAAPTATRRDLQLGRRLIHMANGVAIAYAYALLFSHQQLVHVFGRSPASSTSPTASASTIPRPCRPG